MPGPADYANIILPLRRPGHNSTHPPAMAIKIAALQNKGSNMIKT
jgi:hypothetical protein